MFKKIKSIFGKEDEQGTIFWRRDYHRDGDHRELMYRFPNRDDTGIQNYKNFGVQGYEKAIFYNTGINGGILEGGFYEIEQEARNEATSIFFFETADVKFDWRVGHMGNLAPTTNDGFSFGGMGEIIVRIVDPQAIVQQLITGNVGFTDDDLKDRLKSLIRDSFHDIVHLYSLEGFVRDRTRERFNTQFRAKLSEEFTRLGLELISVGIEDIIYPDEIKPRVNIILQSASDDALDSLARTKARKDRKAEEMEDIEESIAQLKKQRRQLTMDAAAGTITPEEEEQGKNRLNAAIASLEAELNDM